MPIFSTFSIFPSQGNGLLADYNTVINFCGASLDLNMVIISFEIDRDAETSSDLPFEMVFKQVKIVKSETTAVNASAPSADQTAPAANMGVAGTQRVDPESNRMKMIWKEIIKIAVGLIRPKMNFFRSG
jgi:hypothetical protein